MSNRSEQPQRIEGGIAEAIRQEIVPAGTSEETKAFLKGIDCDKAIKCGRCNQYDIELSWGEELEGKPGWFEQIATCRTCHLTWCCAFMVRSAIETGFESKKEGE